MQGWTATVADVDAEKKSSELKVSVLVKEQS